MKRRPVLIWTIAAMFVLAAIFCYGFWFEITRWSYMMANGVPITAEVVHVYQYDFGRQYRVSFIVDGHEFTPILERNPQPKSNEGESLEVVYDPDDPTTVIAVQGTFPTVWLLGTIVFGLIGFIGVFLWVKKIPLPVF